MPERRKTRPAALGALAAAAIAAALPSASVAHDARFGGRVTIKSNPDFHGRVASSKPGCERERRVQIYRRQGGPDGLLASTTTDDQGRWEYLAGQLTGDFYARIRPIELRRPGHDHLCRGDRSKVVSVQAPPPP